MNILPTGGSRNGSPASSSTRREGATRALPDRRPETSAILTSRRPPNRKNRNAERKPDDSSSSKKKVLKAASTLEYKNRAPTFRTPTAPSALLPPPLQYQAAYPATRSLYPPILTPSSIVLPSFTIPFPLFFYHYSPFFLLTPLHRQAPSQPRQALACVQKQPLIITASKNRKPCDRRDHRLRVPKGMGVWGWG